MSQTHICHIFLCVNRKASGKGCARFDAEAMFEYLKEQLTEKRPLFKQDRKVKVVKTSCLGRCKIGPNIFISPDDVWYTFKDKADIDAILDSHFIEDKLLTRCLQPRMGNEPVQTI